MDASYHTGIVAPNSLTFDLVANVSQRLGLRVNLSFLTFFETRSESRHHLVFRSDHLGEGKFIEKLINKEEINNE